MFNAAVRPRLQLGTAYAALLGEIRKLRRCRSPNRALDTGTHHVRSRFHAMDVIGEAFHRLLCYYLLFEPLRGKLCGLKQASDFVYGR
jgi:hypothetical protein